MVQYHWMVSKAQVLAALREINDPEIPINIVDLGLVYDVMLTENDVSVKMTLTTPFCPIGPHFMANIEQKIAALAGVGKVTVELVWDPPWSADKMTEQAREELGLL